MPAVLDQDCDRNDRVFLRGKGHKPGMIPVPKGNLLLIFNLFRSFEFDHLGGSGLSEDWNTFNPGGLSGSS